MFAHFNTLLFKNEPGSSQRMYSITRKPDWEKRQKSIFLPKFRKYETNAWILFMESPPYPCMNVPVNSESFRQGPDWLVSRVRDIRALLSSVC